MMRTGIVQGRLEGDKKLDLTDILKVVSYPNQIRGLILASLFLQITLALFGRARLRSKSQMLHSILWSAYLMADAVAISALSLIVAHNFKPYEIPGSSLPNLVAFWSPFLLLHLGGPDAMTALSLEDNILWWRHLLGLVVHAGMASFILIRSFCHSHSSFPPLLTLSTPIFIAGFCKYLERTLALMSASFPQMRYSDIMFQDPSILDYQSKVAQYWPPDLPLHEQHYKIIFEAHYLFPIFKRVFLNLSIDYNSHNIGKYLFRHKDWKEVFKVIEIELQIMFEALYTKALPHRATTRFILKFLSFCFISTVFIIFLFQYDDVQYDRSILTDLGITYILLGGALVLEIYQGILMLFNDWTIMMIMKQKNKFGILHRLVLKALPPSRLDLLYEPPRWSNTMGQCNLVSICLHSTDVKPLDKLTCIKMKRLLWVRDMLEKLRSIDVTHKPIDSELKELVLKHLWERVRNWEAEVVRTKSINLGRIGISMEDVFRSFLNRRGGWILEKHECQEKYGWTTSLEIDHSILLWHIATDICYYKYFGSLSSASASTSTSSCSPRSNRSSINCSLSKGLSDHLMFLLLKHPTVVTSKLIPDKRFKEVCKTLQEELVKDPRRVIERESEACDKLYENSGEKIDLNQRKKQSSLSNISVIEEACILVKSLMSENPEKKWEIIIGMWLEMLVYVANQCPGDRHAAQLTHGGTLITHVWLLMTHLGISTPCEPSATIIETQKARFLACGHGV